MWNCLRRKQARNVETIVKPLKTEKKRGVIPTTFVALSPDKMSFAKEVDVLYGLFHIMWEDMPRPRTYVIRMAEQVTRSGDYAGCCLLAGSPLRKTINF
jgi:hypothetical protein